MPFHPLIVHFPIVLLIAAGLAYFIYALQDDVFYLRVANLAHIGGFIFAALSIFTGNQAESAIPHPPDLHEMIEQHALLAWVVVWTSAVLFLWQMLRSKRWATVEKWGFVVLFIGMLGILSFSSHLGGRMVYEKGAGVLINKEIMKNE